MKRSIKFFALVLSILLLWTMIPVKTFAQADEPAGTEAISEETSTVATGEETSSEHDGKDKSPQTEPTESSTGTQPSDSVKSKDQDSSGEDDGPAATTVNSFGLTSFGVNNAHISGTFVLVGSTLNPSSTENPYEVWLEVPFTVMEGTNAKELTDTILAENGYTAGYASSSFGDYLNKITPPADKTTQFALEGGVTNGVDSGWMWALNGGYALTGADAYTVEDGDEIRWYFINDWNQDYNGYPDIFVPEADTISGTFVLVGSTLNPSSTENPYEVWLEVPFTVAEGTDAKELTDTILAENGYIAGYASSSFGDYLNKITPPADITTQFELEGGVTNGVNSGWMWALNGGYASTGADAYAVEDGDEIRWYFINDWNQDYNGYPDQFGPEEEGSPTLIDPEAYAARPFGLTSWWPAFGGSMKHNSTKDLTVNLEGFKAKEVFTMQKSGGWTDFFSDPIQVGSWIYVVFSDTLYKLNRDGTVNRQAKLDAAIDSTSRIAYADGLIVVPIKEGKVQALTADNLKTVWLADKPNTEDEMQSLSSLKIVDGVVYQGLCTVGWAPRSFGGAFRALNLNDGSTKWEYISDQTGFYWGGGVLINGALIIGNDLGEITSFNPETGAILDKMTLPVHSDGQAPAIRTNMAASGNLIFFISQQDGTLNRLNVGSNGSLGALKRVKFADSSTASPTIKDGKVYVAGLNTLTIINANKMTIEKSYVVEGNIQSTPLVIKDKSGKIFVYFTINAEPGGIYGLTPSEDIVHTVYTPAKDQQNWCMASLSVSSDGTLYYSNDSLTFFAVKLAQIEDEQPADEDGKEDDKGNIPATGEDLAPQYMPGILLLAASAMVFILKRKLINS